MSVLYLHFQGAERDSRVQQLARSGAHILVCEPRWPGFFETAKKEKPYAIAIDFSSAPSHALETADYLAKAKETREATIFLLRVPEDRRETVRARLPQASVVTERELAERLAEAEKQAQARAREKKEAAAQARKSARAKKSGEKAAALAPAKPPTRPKKRPAAKKSASKDTKTRSAPASRKGSKRSAARPPKKK